MIHPVDFARRYPGVTIVIFLACIFAVFGWQALVIAIVSIVFVSLVARLLTDDDDWSNPQGPRPA